MAIRVIKEVNRFPGFSVPVDSDGVPTTSIIAGKLVRLVDATHVTLADAALPAATNLPVGPALEDTVNYSSYVNGRGTVTDSNWKGGGISAPFGDGVIIEVYNDGRGKVFDDDCINAAVGSMLYCGTDGVWSTTAGSSTTVGEKVLAQVLSAPTEASGVLRMKLFSFK